MDFDDQQSLCQLNQVFMSFDMIEDLHSDLSVSVQTLKEKCLSTLVFVSWWDLDEVVVSQGAAHFMILNDSIKDSLSAATNQGSSKCPTEMNSE